MTHSLGIKRGPQWWKASALTTRPPLLGGGRNRVVNLPSPYFLSQFLPPPYFSFPHTGPSRSILPNSQFFFFSLLPTFSPYFSLLPTFFGPFLSSPYFVPPPSPRKKNFSWLYLPGHRMQQSVIRFFIGFLQWSSGHLTFWHDMSFFSFWEHKESEKVSTVIHNISKVNHGRS